MTTQIEKNIDLLLIFVIFFKFFHLKNIANIICVFKIIKTLTHQLTKKVLIYRKCIFIEFFKTICLFIRINSIFLDKFWYSLIYSFTHSCISSTNLKNASSPVHFFNAANILIVYKSSFVIIITRGMTLTFLV